MMPDRRRRQRAALAIVQILSILSILSTRSLSQSVDTWAERFDRMDKRLNGGLGHSGSLNTNGELAWGESYLLRGYVQMFRATDDRAYLDSFIEQFDRVLKNRDDVRRTPDYYRKTPLPAWGSNEYSNGRWHVWAVHTGMICLGPAEFVRAVRSTKRLRKEYAAKADEYLARITESVACHDREWRDGPAADEGYYTDPGMGPLPLNQQNALGSVFVELYRITGERKFKERAGRLAAYFKRRLRHTPDGAYDWSYAPRPNAPGSGSEDISHAAINVDFALRCRWAHLSFRDSDLRMMARTWTAHVRRAPNEWADTVGGSGGPNSHMPQALGRWLDLAAFDRSLIDDARRAFASAGEQPNEANMLGIAMLARWERQLRRHPGPHEPEEPEELP